ncbi:MAG: amidohydrolase family protein [Bryobacteraceae bacterium]
MRLMALACVAMSSLIAAESNTVLIQNVTIHSMTSADIQNGSVLLIDGKIAEVGTGVQSRGDARVIDGHGLQLYPGLINAATNVGLSEISSLRDSVDLDEIGLFNPELRAEVAFNPSSEHIDVTRASGITTVISLPGSGGRGGFGGGSGNVITGQGALMHLEGSTWEEMAVKRSAVMDMLFPEIATVPRQFPAAPAMAAVPGGQPRTYSEAEKQYKQRLVEVGEFFEQARRYEKAKAAGGADFRSDIRLEAMLPVIDGKLPLLVRAERERMIKDAVEFADKQKVKIIIADPREIGSTGPLLKARNIPVVLGKTFQLPMRDDDPYDAPYTLPNEFFKAGVKICFGTFDVEFARNVPFEAAQAVAFGLPHDEALKGLTINSAQIFGVADQLGSIEKGKLADLILTDGDPMEAKTNIKGMFIGGREVSLESRHTREFEKWRGGEGGPRLNGSSRISGFIRAHSPGDGGRSRAHHLGAPGQDRGSFETHVGRFGAKAPKRNAVRFHESYLLGARLFNEGGRAQQSKTRSLSYYATGRGVAPKVSR